MDRSHVGRIRENQSGELFLKTVVVLDSDKENEVERSINVQGLNDTQCKRLVEASNVNNEETIDFNSGRAIRDDSLQFNINVPENFDNLNDNTICTPRYTNQMENVKTPPTNSDLINDNESQDLRIILVHSSDTSYTLSDTPMFINKSIPDNNNNGTIDSEIEQGSRTQTRSRVRNNDILNSVVRT